MPINMKRCITHGIVKHETIQACSLCASEQAEALKPSHNKAMFQLLCEFKDMYNGVHDDDMSEAEVYFRNKSNAVLAQQQQLV